MRGIFKSGTFKTNDAARGTVQNRLTVCDSVTLSPKKDAADRNFNLLIIALWISNFWINTGNLIMFVKYANDQYNLNLLLLFEPLQMMSSVLRMFLMAWFCECSNIDKFPHNAAKCKSSRQSLIITVALVIRWARQHTKMRKWKGIFGRSLMQGCVKI